VVDNNCVINAIGIILPRFYNLRGERLCAGYIKFYKSKTYMAWMISFLFKEFFSFFKRSIPTGILKINRHSLIMDGHGLHVTLEAIR
jgi:hypothetical protein